MTATVTATEIAASTRFASSTMRPRGLPVEAQEAAEADQDRVPDGGGGRRGQQRAHGRHADHAREGRHRRAHAGQEAAQEDAAARRGAA